MQGRFRFWIWWLLGAVTAIAQPRAMTVSGPISPEEMGRTLIHEHILVDWIGADSTGYHRWDKEVVFRRALPYLDEVKKYGVRTLLDCTPAFLGRDPRLLKMLSDATGLHILTNTGYYGSGNNKYVPKYAMEAPAETIARDWIREFEEGIDNSGIHPGFIKISVESNAPLSAMHRKLVRAAGLTHLQTGLTIVSHTGPDGPALAQIRILKDMGVHPSAFVWTHAQNGTMEGYMTAAGAGAWISLDNVRYEPSGDQGMTGTIGWFVKTLSALREKGVLDHVLISHDSGWYHAGVPDGGEFRGYTDIFTRLIPALKEEGFTRNDIDMLLRDNPRRAYVIQVRKYGD